MTKLDAMQCKDAATREDPPTVISPVMDSDFSARCFTNSFWSSCRQKLRTRTRSELKERRALPKPVWVDGNSTLFEAVISSTTKNVLTKMPARLLFFTFLVNFFGRARFNCSINPPPRIRLQRHRNELFTSRISRGESV